MKYYPEYLAGYFRARVAVKVYSTVDPDREYLGETTIEFNEPEDPTTTTFLSGASRTSHSMVVCVRVSEPTRARAAVEQIRPILENALDSLVPKDAESWSLDEIEIAPDKLGLVEGDSFYGYIRFTINERKP